MQCAVDYQIFQRNVENYADVPLSGNLADVQDAGAKLLARAVREDDELEIVGWTPLAKDQGRWFGELKVPAGGLYRLEVSAQSAGVAIEWAPRILIVRHVGVGELYMLTGQSNMAGYGRDMAMDPPQLGVHLYGNNGRWTIAAHPLNDSVGTIYPENAEYPSATSPALSFGRMMANRLHVPVGLIQASLGGSPLSAWHPEENGVLYRAMVRRLDATGPIGGVIWYQGCSDANENDAPEYLHRFERMVSLWRSVMGNIPFVTVQLNRVNERRTLKEDRLWGQIREAQRQAPKCIRGVYVIPTTDLSQTDGIHNSSGANIVIGERMAHALLKGHYHLPGAEAPNVRAAVALDDTHVAVSFQPGADIVVTDPSAPGIDIEDADGFVPLKLARSEDGKLFLTASRPFSLPAQFHALWRCLPPAYFPRDRYGMPMLSCYGVPIEKAE